MTSSKVVNLPRDPSLCSFSALLAYLHHHNTNTNMDELLKSIYPSSSAADPNFNSGAAATAGGGSSSISGSKEMDTKTVDDVWKEIVAGNESHSRPQRLVGSGAGAGAGEVLEEMTLEDFLTKAGAVREEDVRGVPAIVAGPGGYGGDAAEINGGAQFAMPAHAMEGSSVEAFGNGIEGTLVGVAAPSGGGKGKRRVMEKPLDKAALQKQRRMIKNRESAARSRERKQAYTVELEYLVTQLEEENARLLKEEADKNKQRFKQLMECLIPVVEKRKPRRMLRRANSVQW